MRISTSHLFNSGSVRLGDMQSNLAKVQEQISSGRRILTPADDPAGASQALVVRQAQAVNEQLGINRQNAKDLLSQEEGVLQGVTGLLQDVKTLIVNAGNGTLDDQQRKFIATELSGIFDEMLGFANATDGAGNYLFAGYTGTSHPFAKAAGGASYTGDQGQLMLQVGASRQMAATDNGADVFIRNKTGNGTFVASAAPGNKGSGTVSQGAVIDATAAAALPGINYSVTFSVAGGVTTYSVDDMDTVPQTNLSTGTYVAGEAITIAGAFQIEIKGAPADGDTFTVERSGNKNIFETLSDLITALNKPVSDPASKAALDNALSTANGNVSNALDNVLTVRASVGIRLKELDTLDSHGDDMNLQYEQQLEQLEGLDYTKAITELTKQKIMLEAAQQSFVKTSGLSLFNFI